MPKEIAVIVNVQTLARFFTYIIVYMHALRADGCLQFNLNKNSKMNPSNNKNLHVLCKWQATFADRRI